MTDTNTVTYRFMYWNTDETQLLTLDVTCRGSFHESTLVPTLDVQLPTPSTSLFDVEPFRWTQEEAISEMFSTTPYVPDDHPLTYNYERIIDTMIETIPDISFNEFVMNHHIESFTTVPPVIENGYIKYITFRCANVSYEGSVRIGRHYSIWYDPDNCCHANADGEVYAIEYVDQPAQNDEVLRIPEPIPLIVGMHYVDASYLSEGRMVKNVESVPMVLPPESYAYTLVSWTDVMAVDGMANWDVRSLVNMSAMFTYCVKLRDLSGVAGWWTLNVRSMRGAFYGCECLTSTEQLSGFDTRNAEDISMMFAMCHSLVDMDWMYLWNLEKVKMIDGTFDETPMLKEIGPAGWYDVVDE